MKGRRISKQAVIALPVEQTMQQPDSPLLPLLETQHKKRVKFGKGAPRAVPLFSHRRNGKTR
jgi:hypothetical protein